LFWVPTVIVALVPNWAGQNTEVTDANALVPLINPVELAVVLKLSVIVLPSTFNPVITIVESSTFAAVPPTVTVSARGTSGWVMPVVIVWGVTAEAVDARIAVVEPTGTFFFVSV